MGTEIIGVEAPSIQTITAPSAAAGSQELR